MKTALLTIAVMVVWVMGTAMISMAMHDTLVHFDNKRCEEFWDQVDTDSELRAKYSRFTRTPRADHGLTKDQRVCIGKARPW